MHVYQVCPSISPTDPVGTRSSMFPWKTKPPSDLWKWVYLLDADCVCFNLAPHACFKLVNAGFRCEGTVARVFLFVNCLLMLCMVLEYIFESDRIFLSKKSFLYWPNPWHDKFYYKFKLVGHVFAAKLSSNFHKYINPQFRVRLNFRSMIQNIWQG